MPAMPTAPPVPCSYVNLLPENDVLRIRRGIRVHSLPELQALLEDLGG